MPNLMKPYYQPDKSLCTLHIQNIKDQDTISPIPGFAEVHLVHGVGHPRWPLVHHVAVLEPTPDDGLTGADVDMVVLLTLALAFTPVTKFKTYHTLKTYKSLCFQ